MNTETLVQKLKDAGVRQADVARALELPPSTICRVFAGEREFTLEEAVAVVTTLGIDVRELFGSEAA